MPDTIIREHLVTGERTGVIDRVELHRITLPPGQAAGRHTHAGGVAGYVTDGRIIFELDGQSPTELRAGDAFFEPAGATVHRFDNASADQPATFIACYPVTGDEPLIQPL